MIDSVLVRYLIIIDSYKYLFKQCSNPPCLRLCELHKKKINTLCLNLNCNQAGLACFDCVTSSAFHIGHLKDLQQIETSEEILNQYNLQCSNLIKQLTKMIDEILFTFQSHRNGIDDKYNLSIKRTKILSNAQINQYISNIIQFEKNQKKGRKMENMCLDFLNKLRNLEIEQQLYLTNFIAKQKKKNKNRLIKLSNKQRKSRVG